MHTGTIVRKAKDQLVPEQYWEKVLADGANVYGCVFTEDGQIILQASAGPTLKALMEIQEEFANKEIVFYLGKFPEGFSEDDLQPYIIHADNNDNTTVVGMIEGDYSNWAQPGSTRADTFFAIENVVVPAVMELWELTESVEGINKGLRNKSRQHAFQNAGTGRGVITLISADGEINSYSLNNTESSEYPWGDVSRTHGYVEKSFPEKVEEAPKQEEMSVIDKLKAAAGKKVVKKAEDTTQKAASTAASVPEVAPAKAVKKAEEPPPSAIVKKKLVTFKIPKGWSNRQRKDMFNYVMGTLPTGWRDMEEVTCEEHKLPKGVVASEAKIKSFEDLKATTAISSETVKSQPEVKEEEFQKETVPDHIVPNKEQPLIPVSQRKDFRDKFLNSVALKEIKDKYVTPIPSMEEVQELEKKLPSFSEQTGVDIENTFRWRHTELMILIRDYPDLAAVLMETYRLGYMKQWKQPVKAETPPTEAATTKEQTNKKVVKKAA